MLYFFNDVLPEKMDHEHGSQALSIIWDCTDRSVCRVNSLPWGRFEAAFHAMAFIDVSGRGLAYLIRTWLLEVESAYLRIYLQGDIPCNLRDYVVA